MRADRIEQERYLTITIEEESLRRRRHSLQPLRQRYTRLSLSLVEDCTINGNERLKVLYDYYHLGDEGSFDFDIKKRAKKVRGRF